MSLDLCYMTATEMSRRFRDGSLSPVEATRAALDRIAAVDGKVNAYRETDETGAMQAAKESEARWKTGDPLSDIDGVPTSIKDLMATKGMATLRGSKTVDPAGPWDTDSPLVARLRDAGAVILGKTTTPEFGWKGVTDSPATGITCNPWNLDKTPGGSSGGASAAAAAGMGVLHVGSDGGGSIRIPAGFAGIFGHKPSFGRIPYHPYSPMGTLSHAGPMTRTVADSLAMMKVMMGEDDIDWFTLPLAEVDEAVLTAGVKGMKIAFSPDFGYADVDDEVAATVQAAADQLAELGAEIVKVDPGFDCPVEIFNKHWMAGAHAGLGALPDDAKALLDPGLQKVLVEGAKVTLAEYMNAATERANLGGHMKQFMRNYDLLITPTLAVPAFSVGRLVPDHMDEDDENAWVAWTPFSYPFNLTQQPACSVPCGFTSAGLPVGLQMVGRMFDDATVFRAAAAYEAATDWTDRRPDL